MCKLRVWWKFPSMIIIKKDWLSVIILQILWPKPPVTRIQVFRVRPFTIWRIELDIQIKKKVHISSHYYHHGWTNLTEFLIYSINMFTEFCLRPCVIHDVLLSRIINIKYTSLASSLSDTLDRTHFLDHQYPS